MAHNLVVRARLAGQGEVVSGGEHYYRSLQTDELKQAIIHTLGSVKGHLGRVTKEMREELVPALQVLRQRTPHGQWHAFLNSIHLYPPTVRKWFERARQGGAFYQLQEVLDDPFIRKAPQARRARALAAAEELSESAYRIIKAYCDGDRRYAVRQMKDWKATYERWHQPGRPG